MKNKKYIMVGSPIITKEIFRKVLIPLNNYDFKPSGGFWSSLHISNLSNISEWFTYLMEATSIAKFKDINQSTIFTLKESAKILTINSPAQILELAKIYPSYHHILGYYKNITNRNTIFNFQKLSQDYDGVYIDFNLFMNQMETDVFDKLGASSLLLFNLDCIKEYQTAKITFNIDNPYSFPYIKQSEIGQPQKIEKESYEHKIISKTSETLYQELISKYRNYYFKDYDDYLSIMVQNAKTLSEIIEKEEYKKVIEIAKYLESKGMHVKKELIIQNFALNTLAQHILQDEERIKTLPKSKIKTPKKYL